MALLELFECPSASKIVSIHYYHPEIDVFNISKLLNSQFVAEHYILLGLY